MTVEEVQLSGVRNSCGMPVIAKAFMLSYQVIVTQIFLNLFIAIIIDAFLS